MFQAGLSTCWKTINQQLFSSYRENGIEAMEICTPYREYPNLNYKEIEKLAKEYEITLWSYHLPFQPEDLVDISKKETCSYTISYWTELLKKAAEIGIKTFVVHPSTEPISKEERPERIKRAKEGLAQLAEIAKKENVVIAVENLPRTCLGNCSSEMLDLISLHSDLRICFDTNHLLFEPHIDFIKNTGKYIRTTHISDYDFINERHWLPGEGKIDWNMICSALKDANYQNPWIYELGFECTKTIIRNRDLTCADFKRNAQEIFAGKTPTVFSVPKENLGMWE